MSYAAATLIPNTITSFAANPASVHEQLSHIDFVARLSLALAAPGALLNPEFQLKIPSSPGLGSLREALTQVEQHAVSSFFAAIARAGLKLLSTRLSGPDPMLHSLDGLRNHVFHGGGLPGEKIAGTMAATLAHAVEDTARSLKELLGEANIDVVPRIEGPSDALLRQDNCEFKLSPLIAISPASGAVLVFSRVTSSSVVLNAPLHESRWLIPRSQCEPEIKRLFKSTPADSFVSDFSQAAIEDLAGFQEPGSQPCYSNEPDGITIHWEHADGSQAKQRGDRLRIGPDNAWQWQCDGVWVGYSEYLRRLANWPILTQRLASILRDRIQEAKAGDNALLPLPNGIVAPFVTPSMRIGALGAPHKAECTFDGFINRLDGDVEANRGTTCLYFVHAEAGAGKTTSLMRMAHERATKCVAGELAPLFLYISARGNVLENLDKAVDAAVAETRVLTSASVRALCRNGLMIPIVDGFDELVGSPTYADALASLRPWLKALGGRGVLVVSARSSYFVSLYEESIRKETNRDISVLHYIAELDRWTPTQRDNYIQQCGVDGSKMRTLPAAELEMLRLPFFARASIGHLLALERVPDVGLIENMMRSYVEREHGKLQGNNSERLVSPEELDAIFEELAEWMMSGETREVSWADLVLVASASLHSALSSELENRLVSLCGIDLAEGGRDRRFRFSHEMILDFFFGRRIGRKLSCEKFNEVAGLLQRSQLTAGAARVVGQVCAVSPALLDGVTAAADISLASGIDSLLGANTGLLWVEAFTASATLREIKIVAVKFDKVNLQEHQLDSVTFDSCSFNILELDASTANEVQFLMCNLQELRISGNGKGLRFKECLIDVVITDEVYGDDPDDISRAILAVGATISSASHSKESDQSDLVKSARFFLGKIHSRAETSIVVAIANRLPDEDRRLKWIMRNTGEWRNFLRALEEHGLAFLDPINASGGAKARIRFTVSPSYILKRDWSEQVYTFWASIAQGDYD
jgi:hypothetical protein